MTCISGEIIQNATHEDKEIGKRKSKNQHVSNYALQKERK